MRRRTKRIIEDLESQALWWDAEAERARKRHSDNVGSYYGTADGLRLAAAFIRNSGGRFTRRHVHESEGT